MLARRAVAALLLVLAAYLLAMAVSIATTMVSMLLEGGFLGLEPELLIPLGMGVVAVSLLIMARQLLAPSSEA